MLNIASLITTFLKNFINIIFLRKKYMIFKITENKSHSMEPNFHEGDYHLIEKTLDFNKIKRFDVLVHFCDIHSMNHIKRVVGLPNEKLHLTGNSFYINNKEIKNFTIPDYINIEMILDSDSFFLISDNFTLLGKSCDSIKNGPLKKDCIIGTVI